MCPSNAAPWIGTHSFDAEDEASNEQNGASNEKNGASGEEDGA